MLLLHCRRAAASRAFCTAGSSKLMSTAMIAITTSSSIRVNPRRFAVKIRRILMDAFLRIKNFDVKQHDAVGGESRQGKSRFDVPRMDSKRRKETWNDGYGTKSRARS